MLDHAPKRLKSRRLERRPPLERIALLLQGGGALGAYQGGVYQALDEANLHPDWIAGISIGAVNSALIAGNPPERRVEKLCAQARYLFSSDKPGGRQMWAKLSQHQLEHFGFPGSALHHAQPAFRVYLHQPGSSKLRRISARPIGVRSHHLSHDCG